MWVYLLASSLLVAVATIDHPAVTKPEDSGFRYPSQIFGHVHMAKTAGTSINAVLSLNFERVCGNKGYSYDALLTNERLKPLKGEQVPAIKDSINRARAAGFSRSQVPLDMMDEIGYDDCDYISLEVPAQSWLKKKLPPMPIELHIPCRNPIEHLLSMCNHRKRQKFSCSIDGDSSIDRQVESCALFLDRFSNDLFRLPNVTLKCFNPVPIDPYVKYLSNFLQKRRFTAGYIHRATNAPRDKSNECLRKNATLMKTVKDNLIENYEYYKFCDSCIGSPDDLLLEQPQI